MDLAALDPTKLLVLMAAGATFALAGLWLMFRPKTDGGSAKLELFGMKFEASSAGLLVFLIGAAFLAVPIFVPEQPRRPAEMGREQVEVPRPTHGAGEAAVEISAAERSVTAEPSAAAQPLGERVGGVSIEAVEAESNNTMASANRIALGTAIDGSLLEGDVDYFAVPVPSGTEGEIVTGIVSTNDVIVSIFDDAGEPLDSGETHAWLTASSASVRIERPLYYVRVANMTETDAAYQLTVAARAE